MTDIIENIN